MVNSQKKGKVAEQAVARYLTRRGLAARRYVRTGTADVHDEGDIRIPGVTFEVKNWSGGLTDGLIQTLLTKLDRQRGDGQLGVLVDRRDRIGEHAAGEWWAHMWLTTMTELLRADVSDSPHRVVTVHLDTFVDLWLASGRAVVSNPFELTQ